MTNQTIKTLLFSITRKEWEANKAQQIEDLTAKMESLARAGDIAKAAACMASIHIVRSRTWEGLSARMGAPKNTPC